MSYFIFDKKLTKSLKERKHMTRYGNYSMKEIFKKKITSENLKNTMHGLVKMYVMR